jgi:DNA repair protein RadC
LFRGTIDGASVHPREIVKQALQRNAAAVIIAHNHPSGVAEPSQAGELITQRVKEALALVDIRLLDHIIVGDGASVSLADASQEFTVPLLIVQWKARLPGAV